MTSCCAVHVCSSIKPATGPPHLQVCPDFARVLHLAAGDVSQQESASNGCTFDQCRRLEAGSRQAEPSAAVRIPPNGIQWRLQGHGAAAGRGISHCTVINCRCLSICSVRWYAYVAGIMPFPSATYPADSSRFPTLSCLGLPCLATACWGWRKSLAAIVLPFFVQAHALNSFALSALTDCYATVPGFCRQ